MADEFDNDAGSIKAEAGSEVDELSRRSPIEEDLKTC